MKKNLLTLFIVTLCFAANAQYTKLLDFDGFGNGKNPLGTLFSDGTFLYGTTYAGGINDRGTIFKIAGVLEGGSSAFCCSKAGVFHRVRQIGG